MTSDRRLRGTFWSLALALASLACQGAAPDANKKRYRRTDNGYSMVLRQGDDVLAQLEQLAKTEEIPGAQFSGFGFVHATFGYFNRDTKTYEPREFRDCELASLNGSIAWKQKKPAIHAHGVVTDRQFQAHGGHLLKLTVGTGSVEIAVVRHEQRFIRARDEALGADVLQVAGE